MRGQDPSYGCLLEGAPKYRRAVPACWEFAPASIAALAWVLAHVFVRQSVCPWVETEATAVKTRMPETRQSDWQGRVEVSLLPTIVYTCY